MMVLHEPCLASVPAMKTLNNRVVVITGAASGIGRALALECARRGARLMLADLDTPGLARVSAEVVLIGATSHMQTTDTGKESDIFALATACVEHYGATDVVINNAGVTLLSPVDKLETADAHWLRNINFWGLVHGCRAFVPQLRSRPKAMLVNISSIFAMVSVPSQNMYNAAKAAVRGFSDSLRAELRDTPVAVLCVHPGGIRTNIVNRARMADLSSLQLGAPQIRAGFGQNARTTAEQAALAIVRAMKAGKTRLLTGMDAKILDGVYRLVPSRASAWVSALGRKRQRAALAQLRTDASPNPVSSFSPSPLSAKVQPSKKFATGLQACRSNVFWKGFASPPKTVAPETPALRPGSAPTGLKAAVSNRS